MPLIFERYRGHDLHTMTCQWSALDGTDLIRCIASWELMDDLQRATGTVITEREAQFEQLQGDLTDMASRKYFGFAEGHRPREILITSRDLPS